MAIKQMKVAAVGVHVSPERQLPATARLPCRMLLHWSDACEKDDCQMIDFVGIVYLRAKF